MRAKEYLEVNKSSIKHFDEVNEIVNQMMPLRHSKDMTDNYKKTYPHIKKVELQAICAIEELEPDK